MLKAQRHEDEIYMDTRSEMFARCTNVVHIIYFSKLNYHVVSSCHIMCVVTFPSSLI